MVTVLTCFLEIFSLLECVVDSVVVDFLHGCICSVAFEDRCRSLGKRFVRSPLRQDQRVLQSIFHDQIVRSRLVGHWFRRRGIVPTVVGAAPFFPPA